MTYQEKAEELRRILRHSSIGECINNGHLAHEIYVLEKGEINDPIWALSAVFQAGKIEGIRQERRKRNK